MRLLQAPLLSVILVVTWAMSWHLTNCRIIIISIIVVVAAAAASCVIWRLFKCCKAMCIWVDE